MLLVQQLLLASHPLSSLQLSLRMVVVQQQLVQLARQQPLLVLDQVQQQLVQLPLLLNQRQVNQP